ncbi:MAG: hypothetical protein CXX69_04865 [Candidatus Thalassarchaeum betae]|uniref:Uncharacterized protein n=1 Tax=Candidatus Thalassarchaeum betae TaxID=2599289 RepID=A0A2V3HR23_9ARCH|nr:MAG: hypothetical protein CXX69_04865 [Candidatus Thalassoarchaea betae]PXF25047.1 MAG: hypothetical protein CXX70_08980 [Euryarchaeota archaeon]HIM13987.1 hypothetical protein [Candidatus Poseidoniales archaeon]HIM93368.1 hypothetical protein [Candidatus Poseidoniales archaeon]
MPPAPTGRNRRLNTVLAAWSCIALGSGVFLTSGESPFALAVAAPLAIAGIALLIAGLGMAGEENVDPEEVAAWEPEAGKMPDAGRVMYRVDTTLESPVRTSILCGRCGGVDWVDGPKPKSHSCSECETLLWESEEE